jgi:hypothetical protein
MPEVGWPPWLPVNGHLPALLSSIFASMLLSRACSALFPAPIQGSFYPGKGSCFMAGARLARDVPLPKGPAFRR